MLVAILLQLRPVGVGKLSRSHGSFAHRAALDLLLRVDPQLSHRLRADSGPKPFTCSPLLGLRREDLCPDDPQYYRLSPERLYAWRLTGLSEEVSRALLELTAQLGGVRLGEAVFAVEEVATASAEHPEAGRTTYEELLARWARAHPRSPIRKVTLRFLTPTTFRVGVGPRAPASAPAQARGWEYPFPRPRWVFGSLLRTWNAFAPSSCSLGEGKWEWNEVLWLNNWRGETRRVELGGHGTVGFVGKFAYRVVPPVDAEGTTHEEAGAEVGRLAGLLAEYAFYAGVGWGTTHGLGQVRPDPQTVLGEQQR